MASSWLARMIWVIVLVTSVLPPGPCTVLVPPRWTTVLTGGWIGDLESQCGRTLHIEAGSIEAGCAVRIADSPIAYDNSFDARARRLQADARAALARRYDAAFVVVRPNEPALAGAALDRPETNDGSR